MLPDGAYDGIVVDAEAAEDGASERIEITIIAGEHKGEMVVMHASGLPGEAMDRLGVPVTLTVVDGGPHLVFDR